MKRLVPTASTFVFNAKPTKRENFKQRFFDANICITLDFYRHKRTITRQRIVLVEAKSVRSNKEKS